MHSRQIVHLDIKPSNIFVADDGQLKIGDYGMAIELPVVDGLDREGDRVYMAPEVLRGAYGKPADLFSLGLVMLEIAAYCDLPESGEAWHNLRRADLSDVPFDECVTGELIEIIRGLLQPDPNLRLTVDHILLHPRVAETVYRRLYPISNRRN